MVLEEDIELQCADGGSDERTEKGCSEDLDVGDEEVPLAFDSLKCTSVKGVDGDAESVELFRVDDCFVDDEVVHEDECSCNIEESPGGTKYYGPNIDDALTPKVGDFFDTIEMAEKVYRKYAELAGFDIRLSNKKRNAENQVTARFFVCNRQGIPTEKMYDSLGPDGGGKRQRNSNLKRCGCLACLKIHYVKDRKRFEVYKFVAKHNHILYDSNEMALSRAKRALSFTDQLSVYNATTSKVGIAKSHRMRSAMKGCLNESGGTIKDLQNFKREMVNFVGNKDAQMLVNTMVGRQKACPNFFFEFKCNDKELISIFWADEIARLNYREFGDVISFDATFRTNKYAMVFVPFVAVDNHKRSVVVGAALMRSETVANYKWVLQAFMKVHQCEPMFVITDQCAAMKQAIPAIFVNSVHRLCMWHIIKKVKEKISVYLAKHTNFIAEFKKIVWNVNMDPTVFESSWHELIGKYDLSNDSWFHELYEIRKSWIPAFFKDKPMSGLMKTTSRSESINAFFNVFHAFWDDLVTFLKSFDLAIESQRRKHCEEEFKNKYTRPRKVSARNIEAHASQVYTRTVFFQFQKELSKALTSCGLVDIERVDGKKILSISQKSKKGKVKAVYKVVHEKEAANIDCECNLFVRDGVLCRHALKVIIEDDYNRIPDRYILRRWIRDLIPAQWLPARVRYGEIDVNKERVMSRIVIGVERILECYHNDQIHLDKFADVVSAWIEDMDGDLPGSSSVGRRSERIEEIMGVSLPNEVNILPPSGVRNKGCGTGKRLVGVREKAIEEAKKPKRLCRTCQTWGRHDSRNCPKRGQ